jgi:hypothetical protein
MATATAPATPAVRVQPSVSFRLADIDPDNTEPFSSKKKAEKRLEESKLAAGVPSH